MDLNADVMESASESNVKSVTLKSTKELEDHLKSMNDVEFVRIITNRYREKDGAEKVK